jgi:5-methylcytosine-specific restriction endonuclease McrA
MPIKPDKKKLYPADWKERRRKVLERAMDCCEGSPRYPDCRAQNGKPHPVTGSKVVLTVAHLDHNPKHNDLNNLRAWCQRCHNTYDAPFRALNRKITKLERENKSLNRSHRAIQIKSAERDKADEQFGWDIAGFIDEYLFNDDEAAKALRLLVDPNHEEFMKRYNEDMRKRYEKEGK